MVLHGATPALLVIPRAVIKALKPAGCPYAQSQLVYAPSLIFYHPASLIDSTPVMLLLLLLLLILAQ